MPFLVDIEVHARFLLALPLLILAELVVHQRMRPVVRQFLERGLIAPDASRARFDAAVASAVRLRNSVVAEVLLIAFVYLVGVVYIWPRYGALSVADLVRDADGQRPPALPAGWWFVYVSLPAVPVHPLPLVLPAVHLDALPLAGARGASSAWCPRIPDRAGGLGFLSGTVVAFAPVLAGPRGRWSPG